MAKIIFLGNEQLAQGIKAKTPIFDSLIEAGYEIAALILPNGHTRKPFAIAKVAEKHQIPVFFTKNNSEILEIIKNTKADIGVLAAFGRIIKDEVIEAFPCGILNIHPSLLPKYRGTTPIESALLNNDDETGVSLMRLAHDMDAGAILGQSHCKITPETTKQALYETLAQAGAKLLIEALPAALTGKTKETEQDHSQATFTKPLDKSMSQLDPENKSALELSREVVAFAGFPKSKYQFLGVPCSVTESKVANSTESELDLLCKDGKYLIIKRLIPENSKEMDAKSFLNGRKK